MINEKNKSPKYEEYEEILSESEGKKNIKWTCKSESDNKSEHECKCHCQQHGSSEQNEMETFVWRVEGEPIKKCTVEVEFCCNGDCCSDEDEDDSNFEWKDMSCCDHTCGCDSECDDEEFEDESTKSDNKVSKATESTEDLDNIESTGSVNELSKRYVCQINNGSKEESCKTSIEETKVSNEAYVSSSNSSEEFNQDKDYIPFTYEDRSPVFENIKGTDADFSFDKNSTLSDRPFHDPAFYEAQDFEGATRRDDENYEYVEMPAQTTFSFDKNETSSERPFHDPAFYEAHDFEDGTTTTVYSEPEYIEEDITIVEDEMSEEECCGNCDGSCEIEPEEEFIEIIQDDEEEPEIEVIEDDIEEPQEESIEAFSDEENECCGECDGSCEVEDEINEDDFIIINADDEEEQEDIFEEAADIIKEFMDINECEAEGCTCNDEDIESTSELFNKMLEEVESQREEQESNLDEETKSVFTSEELAILDELSKPEVKLERQERSEQFESYLNEYTDKYLKAKKQETPKVEEPSEAESDADALDVISAELEKTVEPIIDVIEPSHEIVEETETKIEAVLDKDNSLETIKAKIQSLEESVKDYEKINLYSQSELIEKLLNTTNATEEEAKILLDSANKKVEFLTDVINRAKAKYTDYDCDFLHNMINKVEDAVKVFKANNNR